jgi:hypothetical protein
LIDTSFKIIFKKTICSVSLKKLIVIMCFDNANNKCCYFHTQFTDAMSV